MQVGPAIIAREREVPVDLLQLHGKFGGVTVHPHHRRAEIDMQPSACE
jgi:hypothetical protein